MHLFKNSISLTLYHKKEKILYHKICSFCTNIQKDYPTALRTLSTLQSNSEAILEWARKRRIDLSLDLRNELLNFCERLSIDIDKLSSGAVHVAGTKGKGSTCAFVESVVRNHGWTTGLYTSPHLITIRERFKINGKSVSENMFTHYFWWCWDRILATRNEKYPALPNFFKMLTLIAFKMFQEEKIDCSVIEVGIGGRTDATNVLTKPVVCGITTLDYDHTLVLGDTIEEIAFEKAGIFKKGVPAVSVPQVPEAMNVLVTRSKVVECPLYLTTPLEEYEKIISQPLQLGLGGNFQRVNAALAIALSHNWLMRKNNNVSHNSFITQQYWNPELRLYQYPVFELTKPYLQGLTDVRWPGRAQILRLKGTNIVLFLDGAHTARATAHCIQWFTTVHKDTNSFHGITELELPSHLRFSTLLDTHSSTSATTEYISVSETKSKPITVLVFNCNPPREPKNLLAPIWNHTDKISEPFDLVVFTTNDIVTPEKKNVFNSNRRVTPDNEDLSRQQQMVEVWKSFSTTNNMISKAEPRVRITKTLNELISILLNIRSQQRESIEIHVLVTGSLYLVGGLLELLGYQID